MLRQTVRAVLVRELRALRRAVETYPDDASPWALPAGLPNAAGTLVLHMAGNLQHFLGAVLGETGYRRDRDAEFARRDLPRGELLAEIDAAISAVEATLEQLTDDAVHAAYPEEIGGRRVETGDWLVHLVAHTAYHLGQVDYHRRLVSGDPRSVGAIAIGELPPLVVRDEPAAPGSAPAR